MKQQNLPRTGKAHTEFCRGLERWLGSASVFYLHVGGHLATGQTSM